MNSYPLKIALVLPKRDQKTVITEIQDDSVVFLPCTSIEHALQQSMIDLIIIHQSYQESLVGLEHGTIPIVLACPADADMTKIYPSARQLPIMTILMLPLTIASIQELKKLRDLQQKDQTDKWLASGHTGATWAVTSFSAGSGVSLISYNVAQKLASLYTSGDAVGLVDLNSPFGVSRAMIGTQEEYSWDTLRPVLKEGTLTRSHLLNVMYQTPYRFHLLPGPTDFETNDRLKSVELQRLSATAPELYQMTIFDMPTISTKQMLDDLEHFDHILVIVDASAIGVLQTSRALQYLRADRPEIAEKLLFVVNRADESRGRSPEIIADRLGVTLVGTVDEDTDAVQACFDAGKLIQDDSLLLDLQFHQLAQAIIQQSRRTQQATE